MVHLEQGTICACPVIRIKGARRVHRDLFTESLDKLHVLRTRHFEVSDFHDILFSYAHEDRPQSSGLELLFQLFQFPQLQTLALCARPRNRSDHGTVQEWSNASFHSFAPRCQTTLTNLSLENIYFSKTTWMSTCALLPNLTSLRYVEDECRLSDEKLKARDYIPTFLHSSRVIRVFFPSWRCLSCQCPVQGCQTK